MRILKKNDAPFHLDCTLRDGGYYNNWNFSKEFFDNYIIALSDIGVDFIELGYKSFNFDKHGGFFKYCPEEILRSYTIPKNLKKKFSAMIDVKEFISLEKPIENIIDQYIPNSNKGFFTLYRLASKIEDLELANSIASILKNKGYLVAININQFSYDSLLENIHFINKINPVNVDVIYIADSFGSFLASDISNIYNLLRKYWNGFLGVHMHDSLNLAINNTIHGINIGFQWFDSTVLGMGRGPGNAKTELIINRNEIPKKNKVIDSTYKLANFIKIYLEPLLDKYKWGASIFYKIAAQKKIHPSYIQYAISELYLSDHELLLFLNKLGEDDRKIFNSKLLINPRKTFHESSNDSWIPSKVLKKRSVLILSGNKILQEYSKEIEIFIKNIKPIVFVLNANHTINEKLIDYRLCCNEFRLIADLKKHRKNKTKVILPVKYFSNNLLNDISELNYINFDMQIDNSFIFNKTSCKVPMPLSLAYAIAVANSGACENIYLAGFVGYSDAKKNIFINDMIEKYSQNNNSCPILSITDTAYNLNKINIYKFL